MSAINSYQKRDNTGPSTFAMLIDDINKMSESEQKLLWIQINKEKISTLAKELDASVVPNNLSTGEIDMLINEARKNGKLTKKKSYTPQGIKSDLLTH